MYRKVKNTFSDFEGISMKIENCYETKLFKSREICIFLSYNSENCLNLDYKNDILIFSCDLNSFCFLNEMKITCNENIVFIGIIQTPLDSI